MITSEGKISFMCELMDLIDEFLDEYEAKRGPLGTELERGLVISYAMGVMLTELKCLSDSHAGADLFGNLDPRLIFKTCAQFDKEAVAAHKAATLKRLQDCEWV